MRQTRGRRGTKTPYGPKHPPTRSHLLTKFATRVLQAAAVRAVASESNIVEHLVRRFAGQICPEELAPINDNT